MRFITTAKAMALAGIVSVTAMPAFADSLENMERERAIMLDTLISGDLSVQERERKIIVSQARLADLERMVLRDDSLVGRDQPAIRNAFENYDLTFVVHAAAEHNRTLADHWLSEIGLSTQAIMNARKGRR